MVGIGWIQGVHGGKFEWVNSTGEESFGERVARRDSKARVEGVGGGWCSGWFWSRVIRVEDVSMTWRKW